MQVNEQRLERTRDALNLRHRHILDLLPLLFHTNHPSLPGYVSHQTAAGISLFEPDKTGLKKAQSLARSFRYHRNSQRQADIYSLFVMGSVGTVAHSERSDLDCWVCHRPGLEGSSRDELKKKGDLITAWAMQQGLEVHFFLMDCDAFRTGRRTELDTESSGSAQHYLLLDEFYRTAIWLAGRHPLWWYVPAECEHDYQTYTSTLLHKRFVNRDHVLDFGDVARIPSEEFIGASIWQLYKSIESPYKSVLKLLILECYSSEYPQMTPLCLDFKRSIYVGDLRTEQLDAYVMIYRRLEQYLLKHQALQRLELVRRCFYIKVDKRLTKPLTSARKSWQRELLEEMVRDWQWSRNQLEDLDKQKKWKTQHVLREYRQLVEELTASYRSLIEFAKLHAHGVAINTQELNILGRKLKTTFSRKKGKVDWVNLNISGDMSEGQLLFQRTQTQDSEEILWESRALKAFSSGWDHSYRFKTSPSLLELIVWSYCNGIATMETRLEIPGVEDAVQSWELRQALITLQNWLPLPLEHPAHNTYRRAALVEKLLVFVNLGNYTAPKNGEHVITANNDPFNFSEHNHNLVHAVDVVSKNSWQEIRVQRFDQQGYETTHSSQSAVAILALAKDYLSICVQQPTHLTPQVACRCLDVQFGKQIEARISTLLTQLSSCFFHTEQHRNNRFLITLAGQHHIIYLDGDKAVHQVFSGIDSLLQHLSLPTDCHRALFVDQESLTDHPLQLLGLHTRSNTIKVFYRVMGKTAQLFVVDERGAIFTTEQPFIEQKLLLRPLHQFIRQVLKHGDVLSAKEQARVGVYPVEFFLMTKNRQQQWEVEKRIVTTELEQLSIFNIEVTVSQNDSNHWQYTFASGDRVFDQQEWGDQVYREVGAYILDRRASREAYPCYISSLDITPLQQTLNPDTNWQTNQYLQLKLILEGRINTAMQDIIDNEKAAV